MDEKLTAEMIHKFERVMSKYSKAEKVPKNYGTKEILYKSEIHTIEAIGKNNKINVTQLALYLGITKGAVSQMIDKLVKKALVNKKLLSPTENEVSLELTEKGWLAYNGHEDYHKDLYAKIARNMEHLSQENIEAFSEILSELENFLDHQ